MYPRSRPVTLWRWFDCLCGGSNIEIDFNSDLFILALHLRFCLGLEVFTSVPPDPVSIVHCRHWVVLFHPAAESINSEAPEEMSILRSCTSPLLSPSRSPSFEFLGAW